ncbi:MAG: GGDEF domain-containing protein [Nautiliaceae bacterium]
MSLKFIFKDLILSLVFIFVMYLFLRFLEVDKSSIPYILSAVFGIIFSFSLFMSLYVSRLQFQLEDLNKEVEKLSKFDEVTDLFNRNYFFAMAQKYMDISKTKKIPLSIMMLDIDYFRNIQNRYGIAFSDKILKEIGKILKERRKGDIIARFGGDEFIIMSFGNKKEFMDFAKDINRLKVKVNGKEIMITFSIGISEIGIFDNMDTAIKKVQEAVILAKSKGGNRVDYLEHFLLLN